MIVRDCYVLCVVLVCAEIDLFHSWLFSLWLLTANKSCNTNVTFINLSFCISLRISLEFRFSVVISIILGI